MFNVIRIFSGITPEELLNLLLGILANVTITFGLGNQRRLLDLMQCRSLCLSGAKNAILEAAKAG